MFQEWSATTCDRDLAPGDTLVLYTDGVIEARAGGEEFGEGRLLDLLRAYSGQPAATIVSAIQAAVEAFTHGPLTDDVTVVVAKGR
jgi:serine phosphatase RsbU (regulator of sigma subunit)